MSRPLPPSLPAPRSPRGVARRFGLALLASGGAHASLLFFGLVRCSTATPAPASTELQVVSLMPADELQARLDRAAARAGAAEPRQSPDAADPSGLAAPEGFDPANLDLEPLTEIDPALLAELDPALLAEIDPALLADLDLGALDPSALDALPPELLASLRALVQVEHGGAVADRPSAGVDRSDVGADSSPSPRAPSAPAGPVAPERDAASSDADASSPQASDPADIPEPTQETVAQQPDEPEPDAEPEPEPEPEDDPDWFDYVQSDPDARDAQSAADKRYISSRTTRADELVRTAVTATAPGARVELSEGAPIRTGSPTLIQVEGADDGGLGDRPAGGAPSPTRVEAAVGGGRQGAEQGLGAPDRGGELEGGAAARSGRSARASAAAVLLAGAPGSEGPPRAPLGEEPEPSAAWWRPAAARIVVVAPRSPETVAVVVAPLPTQADALAPVPRPARRASRGGTERSEPIDELAPEELRPEPLPETGEEVEVVETEHKIETFADLRAELGWGGVAQTEEAPRRVLPGVQTDDGHLPTSPQVAASDARVEQVVFIDATDTTLGRYRERLDEEIRALWLASDLSLHDRALGLQGDTTIEFRIVHGGRVEEKRIVRSSGYLALDGMALSAIPDKLPRIPRDVDAEVVYHRYTFRYRNPLITQSAP